MSQFAQKSHSLWQEIAGPELIPLTSNLTTDVCIVGAGISGLTSAYMLLKKGVKVVVIDKENFGQNETGLTTAHISNALDDRYLQLRKWHGAERTRLAYESHTKAIDMIEKIVQDESVDCDFARVDGYLFLGPEHTQKYLEEEQMAARAAGFYNVELLSRAPTPFFESGPCLRFPQQAQFHALKYLQGLALAIRALGGEIYGNTKAIEINGAPLTSVKTEQGYSISCNSIIVASNVPINDVLTMHTKESAYRSYAIGLKVPKGEFPPALLWDTTDPYHYVRVQPQANKAYDILIVGGEDHRVGQSQNTEKCFSHLEEWAYFRLGMNPDVLYRWSGQIIEPIDGLAYIGKNPGDKDNVYIATGDSGHGTTHGTIAGILLSDLITGQKNSWQDLYDPRRFNWNCLGTYASENFQGAMQLADWFAPGEKSRDQIVRGEGAILTEGLNKVAVYRDELGELHEFSAACPHLRGVLRWNSSEKTWDCPFHGSRFSKMGEVLNGPSLSDMTMKSQVVPVKRTGVNLDSKEDYKV